MSTTRTRQAGEPEAAESLPEGIALPPPFVAHCFKVWVLYWDAYLLRKLQDDCGPIQIHDATDILQNVYVTLFADAPNGSGSPFVKLLYPLASRLGDRRMMDETSGRTAAFARVAARNQFLKTKRGQKSQRRLLSILASQSFFGVPRDAEPAWSPALLERLESALLLLDAGDREFLRDYYSRLYSRRPASQDDGLTQLSAAHWDRAARLRSKLRTLMADVDLGPVSTQEFRHHGQSIQRTGSRASRSNSG